MLKMFTTQLTGLFKKIQDKEDLSIEDGARLLSQALIGDGHIFIFAENELSAVQSEAIHSKEPLQRARVLEGLPQRDEVTVADRVLILARTTLDERAVAVGKALEEKGIPFVSVATVVEGNGESLNDLAHVHIDLQLKKGLLPDEEGNRYGYPASMAALYVYYGLKFTIDEIMEEY
ncbi:DUF2529 domain-containing protein [Robertmurraya korlensis]|uniref:DUF2529 domain-containing protein n=1 Tax=Robertmurraya korlensis TaxID=519977 RepID=UPI0020419957|nr:DUF2529 domain-containing protein [Robertmurraya korlensis]MCM3602075.1 DUF2529 domain-containing protein [Robertmurraya korlensis]